MSFSNLEARYVVNIARTGTITRRAEHFFDVEVRMGSGSEEVIRELAERFPASEGFEVTVTSWEPTGKPLGDAQDVANQLAAKRVRQDRFRSNFRKVCANCGEGYGAHSVEAAIAEPDDTFVTEVGEHCPNNDDESYWAEAE